MDNLAAIRQHSRNVMHRGIILAASCTEDPGDRITSYKFYVLLFTCTDPHRLELNLLFQQAKIVKKSKNDWVLKIKKRTTDETSLCWRLIDSLFGGLPRRGLLLAALLLGGLEDGISN